MCLIFLWKYFQICFSLGQIFRNLRWSARSKACMCLNKGMLNLNFFFQKKPEARPNTFLTFSNNKFNRNRSTNCKLLSYTHLDRKMDRTMLSNRCHTGMWNRLKKKHYDALWNWYREWSTLLKMTCYLYYVICNNNK